MTNCLNFIFMLSNSEYRITSIQFASCFDPQFNGCLYGQPQVTLKKRFIFTIVQQWQTLKTPYAELLFTICKSHFQTKINLLLNFTFFFATVQLLTCIIAKLLFNNFVSLVIIIKLFFHLILLLRVIFNFFNKNRV